MAGKKIDAFAGLRGYAIILVFLSHYSFGANSKGLNITNWLGALGVEVFIILSGFLLMENHGNTMFEFKPYYIRKVKKFYPLHFIMLLMAIPFSVKPLLGLDIEKWIALFSQVMLVQTWFPKPDIYFSFNGVAWYLSLTVFFIAVSPLTVKIWNKLTMRSSVIMMAGIAAAEIILCVVFRKSAFAHWILYVAPFVRILDFFMGGGAGSWYKPAIIIKNQNISVISQFFCWRKYAACPFFRVRTMNGFQLLFGLCRYRY